VLKLGHDLVLMDVSMPGMNVFEASSGYLLEECALDAPLVAIQTVAASQIYVSAGLAASPRDSW
jgi:DNA-binding NarL/FixJ family response regulator